MIDHDGKGRIMRRPMVPGAVIRRYDTPLALPWLCRKALEDIPFRAVKHHPTAESLWLLFASERCLAGDVPSVRDIIEEAVGAKF